MKKLAIEHLAPYLPCKVSVLMSIRSNPDIKPQKKELTGRLLDYILEYDSKYESKLILHPLSDLTKEIEVNGEKFVPLVKLAEMEFEGCNGFDNYKFDIADSYPLDGENYIEFLDNNDNRIQIVYSVFMNLFVFFNISTELAMTPCLYNKEMADKLLEWHFDIFELINKGLAIDINTL